MLLLGGSAVVNALTGVNIYAASFLIPLGVIVYTLAGGLKATFLASYIHSVIGDAVNFLFICCFFLLFYNKFLATNWILLYYVSGSSSCGFGHICVPCLYGKQ